MTILDWLQDYEVWTTTAGGRPTVAVLSVVWIALVLVHLPTIRTWPKSIRAFVSFAVVNVLVWDYTWWGRDLIASGPRRQAPPETGWLLHMSTILIHLLIISGLGLIVALVGKYVYGWEDPDPVVTPRRRESDWRMNRENDDA